MGHWYAKNRLLVNTGILAYVLSFLGGACGKKPEGRKRTDAAATENASQIGANGTGAEDITAQENTSQDKKSRDTETTSQEDSDKESNVTKTPPRKDKKTAGQTASKDSQSVSSPAPDRSSESPPVPNSPESQAGNTTKPPVSSKTPENPENGEAPKTLDTDILFSINLMTKLCQDLQSRQFRDLGTKILALKNNSLNDLANKTEYGKLTIAELETMKSVLVKIEPELVDEFEEVLCDDFDGSGKIYKFDVLINKIKNQ